MFELIELFREMKKTTIFSQNKTEGSIVTITIILRKNPARIRRSWASRWRPQAHLRPSIFQNVQKNIKFHQIS